MLKVNNIDVYYGKVEALVNASLEVDDGSIVALIGANGAGKSTLMKTISGINHVKNGNIEFDGKVISNRASHLSVYDGIVYVPEGREVFPQMSVHDNLEMGAFSKKFSKQDLQKHLDEVYELFPRLKEREKQAAGTMSGGEQQMLAIARGLMSDPKLLMLDEPSLGLAPVIVDDMFRAIVRIAETRKISILVAEQNAFMAMSISDMTYVLEVGRITSHGKSSELLQSPEIKKAYLGG